MPTSERTPSDTHHGEAKKLKKVLKMWNQNVFGKVEEKIRTLEREFEEASLLANTLIDNIEVAQEDSRREMELMEAIENRDQLMRHKLKKQWIYDGERNSKLLHALYRDKMKRSLIVELQTEEGIILNDQNNIREALNTTFQERFRSQPVEEDDEMLSSLPKMFLEEDNSSL